MGIFSGGDVAAGFICSVKEGKAVCPSSRSRQKKPLVFFSSFLKTGREQAFSQFIFLPSLVEGKLFFGTLLISE